jgi:hypothetical protein
VETIGETGLEDDFGISVLSSMAPINEELPFDRRQHESARFYECFSDQISDFFSKLSKSQTKEVKEQLIKCRCCTGSLVYDDLAPTHTAQSAGLIIVVIMGIVNK